MGSSAQEAEGKYTKSDRRIMDFVEDYTDEFLFMSIGQLSGRLGNGVQVRQTSGIPGFQGDEK